MNLCQVSDIISEKETVERTAQRIVQNGLSEKDVKVITRVITETAPNPITFTFCLTRI